MGFNVTCTPGKEATAGYIKITPELPALVLYLDPTNMVIQLPPMGGSQVLARFCRELAEAASTLAADIDPDGEPDPEPDEDETEDEEADEDSPEATPQHEINGMEVER